MIPLMQVTLARKTSLFKGRNLERDQVHIRDRPATTAGWVKEKEENNKHMYIIHV